MSREKRTIAGVTDKAMRTIVFATANPGKIREAQEILGEGFRLITPAEMGITEEIPETGKTLQENSLQKAEYLYERLGCDCFADDTGLEVDMLGGAPGVHTARYGGKGRDFNANMDKLLGEMARKEQEWAADAGKAEGGELPRTARFRTSVTLILNGEKHFFNGIMEGTIARSKAGCGGFGYDPVFQPAGKGGLTAAEISEDEKNAISHRGKALRAMAAFLREQA